MWGLTDLTDLVCGAYVVCSSDGSYVVHWRGCKSERQSVGFGEEEVSSHMSLLLAAGEEGEMQNYERGC